MSTRTGHLTILGGGVAGLAIGYYAAKRHIAATLYEAGPRVGGNCITLARGPFRYDSGAHRFHDKDPIVTRDVKSLLGPELRSVSAPSQIYFDGKFIQFPLTPLNALQRLGWRTSIRAVRDVLASRLLPTRNGHDFGSFAVRAYGETIAKAFLLGYSEKLWGVPPERLSPRVSGQRLAGLNIRSFVREALRGGRATHAHLDGTFYYPTTGYGAIADALAARCEEIRLNARVTRVVHRDGRIRAIEVGQQEIVQVDEVASTLPLTLLLKALDPPPDERILAKARTLTFRNVMLVAIFLDRPSITTNATVYFPSPDVSFTRVYEPRNRSPLMAPPGKTSLVAEIPCQHGDRVWMMSERALIGTVTEQLSRLGWFSEADVIDACVDRIPFAYPVLDLGFDAITDTLMRYLERFPNLRISGRSGRFAYTHLHDMMRFGHDIVDDYCGDAAGGTRPARRPLQTV